MSIARYTKPRRVNDEGDMIHVKDDSTSPHQIY